MAIKIKSKHQSKQGGVVQMMTKVKGTSGAEKITHDEEPAMLFDKPFCDVTVMGGQTINVGNYNSVRFSVAIKMPCTKEDVESTYTFCKNWVDTKMQGLQDEVKGDAPQQGQDVNF